MLWDCVCVSFRWVWVNCLAWCFGRVVSMVVRSVFRFCGVQNLFGLTRYRDFYDLLEICCVAYFGRSGFSGLV